MQRQTSPQLDIIEIFKAAEKAKSSDLDILKRIDNVFADTVANSLEVFDRHVSSLAEKSGKVPLKTLCIRSRPFAKLLVWRSYALFVSNSEIEGRVIVCGDGKPKKWNLGPILGDNLFFTYQSKSEVMIGSEKHKRCFSGKIAYSRFVTNTGANFPCPFSEIRSMDVVEYLGADLKIRAKINTEKGLYELSILFGTLKSEDELLFKLVRSL